MANKILKTVGALSLCAVVAGTTWFTPHVYLYQEMQKTGAYVTEASAFVSTLHSIEEDHNISFCNQEIYQILFDYFGGSFTVGDLRNIKSLTISETLQNSDLSDLKYLTNLEYLMINKNKINCRDLMYNQNLTSLHVCTGELSNTTDLPNSITHIVLDNTTITDRVLTVPFDTGLLYCTNTSFSKVVFKNPSKLNYFLYEGYGFLDLNDFRNCENLKGIKIYYSPNVLNSEVLTTFTSLENLEIDEFAVTWIEQETLDNVLGLSRMDKEHLTDLLTKINKKIEEIVNSDMTEEEIIKNITIFVLRQMDYDFEATENNIKSQAMLHKYNSTPITCAFDERTGVCVGYATLFKAFLKQTGIDNYQADSIVHTWNMIKTSNSDEYKAYDLTNLDNPYAVLGETGGTVDKEHGSQYYLLHNEEDKLYYYDFTPDTSSIDFQTNVYPEQIGDITPEIGYVNLNSPARKDDTDNKRFKVFTSEMLILYIAYLVRLAYKTLNKTPKIHPKQLELTRKHK